MKYLFLILLFVTGTKSSLSQPPAIQWHQFLGNSSGSIGFFILPTADGGFLTAGHAFSNGGMITDHHGGTDIWLTRYRADRSVLWQKCLGGSQEDRLFNNGTGGSILSTADGGFLISGNSNSSDGDHLVHSRGQNNGDYDAWLIKLSDAGVIQWQRSIGGSAADEDCTVRQLANGNYLLAGSTASNNGLVTGNHGRIDTWIVNLSNDGSTIHWSKCLGSSEVDLASDMQLTSDGGFIVSASTRGNDGDVSGNHSVGAYDYWIVKCNSTGAIEWQRCIGGIWGEDMALTLQTATDGYVVAGYTDTQDGDVANNHGNGTADIWIVKLSFAGSIDWQRSIGSIGNEIPNSIKRTSDGGWVICGYTDIGFADGDVGEAFGETDVWIAKLSAGGTLEWAKTMGGTSYDWGFDAAQVTDGGIVICGRSNSAFAHGAANPNSFSLWLIKLAPTIILPVHLLDFLVTRRDRAAIVQWQTSYEKDNDYFVLEKSLASADFIEVARVEATNRLSGSNYVFSDNGYVYSVIHKYRLRQVDKNGQHSYSKVITVLPLFDQTFFRVLHNPVLTDLQLNYSAGRTETITVVIYNASGQTVLATSLGVLKGEGTIRISTSSLSPGIYWIQLQTQSGAVSRMQWMKK